VLIFQLKVEFLYLLNAHFKN